MAQTQNPYGTTTPSILNRKAVSAAFLEQATYFDGTSFVENYYPITIAEWQNRPAITKNDVELAQKLEDC